MANKKFSDLTALAAIADADLFAVTDADVTTSKKVVATKITDYVLSDTNIGAKSATIISKLNGTDDSVANGLKAQKLYYLNEHRDASYFLAWDNVSGKPTIPTDTATFGTVAGFNNSGNFVSFDSVLTKIKVSGTGSTALTITSDHVTEGSTNLFYDDAKVDARQELNFGNLFNTYSSTFDSGTVTESLQDVPGTFQAVTNDQSYIIRVSDKTLESNFSKGQRLRIYGASLTNAPITAVPNIGSSISLTGFSSGTTAGYKQFEYKAALFNLITGEVGPSSAALSANVDIAGSTENVLTKFNRDTFLSLTITGATATQGVLVYRQVGGSGGFKLVAVLGPKDLSSTWKDYYTFDFNAWSGKNATDNSYTSITHFPLTAPSTAQRGWVDVNIDSIQTGGAHFDINLGQSNPVYVNTSNAVQIAHNDTNTINDAIVTKSSQGRKDIQLNAKTYNASHIEIPSNFGLVGTSNITKIKKLPWSSYISSTPDNSLIRSQAATNANAISLVGIDLDGNLTSQYLLSDSVDLTANYIVDFGINPNAILIDRCRIKNVIGGGVYATSPNQFKMSTSEIVNSGVTDRYQFSPLIVDNGTTTIVTSNRFENFTDFVDVSVTTEGVVANNIVKSCGSGIFTYGSTFFLSSPNVLMGAANEFLPSPDILNSEFDSVNIERSQFGATTPYTSDTYTYQENGADFDISRTSIPAEAGKIVYRCNLIRKLSNGAEEVYGNEVGPGATGINGFPFSTVTDDGFVDNNNESYRRYRITEVGDVNWTNIGAATATVGTSFEYNGNNVTGTSGKATPDEFVGYPNQNTGTSGTSTKMIHLRDLSAGMDRTRGQFSFEINDANPTSDPAGSYTNLKSGIYSQGNLTTLYNSQVVGNEAVKTFNGSSAVTDATESINLVGHGFSIGDQVRYNLTTGSTTITNLASGTVYHVSGCGYGTDTLRLTDTYAKALGTTLTTSNLSVTTASGANITAASGITIAVGDRITITGNITTGAGNPTTPSGYNSAGPLIAKVTALVAGSGDNVTEFTIKQEDGSNIVFGSTGALTGAVIKRHEIIDITSGSNDTGHSLNKVGIHPSGSQHVGIHWTASYRYYVNAGTITQAGTWNDSGGDRATNPEYTVRIAPSTLRVPLAPGKVVRIDEGVHTGFGIHNTHNKEGVITNITTDNDVTIKYYGGGSGSGNTAGAAAGTINIIDDFIMAQGLIK